MFDRLSDWYILNCLCYRGDNQHSSHMWWKVGVFDRLSDWYIHHIYMVYVTVETTNIVATCGGKLVCLIDCQTGIY